MSVFSLPFMQAALLVGVLAGSALAVLGLFVQLRRVAFSGLAVAQLAALGTVAGMLLELHYLEFPAAVVCVALGLGLIDRLSTLREAPAESWVASVYVAGAGLAVLLLAKTPLGESHTLNVFFGNVLSLSAAEAWEAAAMSLVVGGTLGAWFYRWVWISFDPLSAQVSGISVRAWNAVFFGLFAVAMTVSIHLFGVLLAFAYLLLPATIGLVLVRRLRSLVIVTLALAAASTWVGLYASFQLDFPPGPFIACLLGVGALLAGLYRSLAGEKTP